MGGSGYLPILFQEMAGFIPRSRQPTSPIKGSLDSLVPETVLDPASFEGNNAHICTQLAPHVARSAGLDQRPDYLGHSDPLPQVLSVKPRTIVPKHEEAISPNTLCCAFGFGFGFGLDFGSGRAWHGWSKACAKMAPWQLEPKTKT